MAGSWLGAHFRGLDKLAITLCGSYALWGFLCLLVGWPRLKSQVEPLVFHPHVSVENIQLRIYLSVLPSSGTVPIKQNLVIGYRA